MSSLFKQDTSASKYTPPTYFLLVIILIIQGIFFSETLYATENGTEDSSPPWYEIELLIFSRINPDPQHNEYWNQYLKLNFASKIGVLDTNFDLSELHYVEVQKEEDLLNTEKFDSSTQKTTGTERVPIYPPYTDLDTRGTKLSFAKSRLKRNGQFRILSHTRWVQPLTDKESSMPLLIQAGNIYNDLYELEGTISISVSRYIHIVSNLWLSSFTENQTLLDTWWLEEDSEQNLTPALSQNQLSKSNQCDKNFDQYRQDVVEKNAKESNHEQSIDYIITQIAQMKQSRRMRSNEIHYLDHPLFGLIVTAKPYTVPTIPIPGPDDSSLAPESPASAAPITRQ